MMANLSYLFIEMNHFYSRLAAPSADEADRVLGNSEDEILDSIQLYAKAIVGYFQESRQEEWEGFLYQVLHVQDDEDDLGSQPDNPDPVQYITRVFSGYPGINDLCERAPWRIEGLLNLARFLSQDTWMSRDRLVDFLNNNQERYMNTIPSGPEGLRSGGGALISGLTGFRIVAGTDLSTQRDELFRVREWVFSPPPGTPMWYMQYLEKFVDNAVSELSGTDPDVGLTYAFDMRFAQGDAIMAALDADWMIDFSWITDTIEEKLAAVAGGAVGYHWLNDTQTSNNTLHRRDYLVDPVPPYFHHQRLLSALNTDTIPLHTQPYRRDSSGGEGITVFILDTGFDLSGYGVSLSRKYGLDSALTDHTGI